MQRVRIGLTGLGFVFVAVLLATALTGAPEGEAPVTGNRSSAANLAPDQPKDPFSEQGLAPGNADKNSGATSANGTQPVAP
jgi:hypothetical protein